MGILLFSYFWFEVCFGMYCPTSAILKGRYVPDSHRTILIALFDVPSNAIMLILFLCWHIIGNPGALRIAATCLTLSFLCISRLLTIVVDIEKEKQRQEE